LKYTNSCFNPCFGGFCSKTKDRKGHKLDFLVSILVLVDFALKLESEKFVSKEEQSFNPCFGGFCSKTYMVTSGG